MQTKELIYIVKIKEDNPKIDYDFASLTTCGYKFCGKLINQSSSHLCFELNGHKDSLVIIPLSYIKWMAPSKKLCRGGIKDASK